MSSLGNQFSCSAAQELVKNRSSASESEALREKPASELNHLRTEVGRARQHPSMTWATKMMDAIRADDKDVAVQALNMRGFNIDEQLQV